jgi:type VI secretion system secreted protein Hcp
MADTIALVITGTVQGLIEGDNTETTLQRENTIEVLSLTHSVRSAFERGTGKATGKRYYEPIRFTKRIDRSTPKLRGALTRNEIVNGTFTWFRSNSQNVTEKFFTIEFTNGRIVSADAQLPNVLDAATVSLPPLEVVELVFDTITWTFVNGGVEAEDTWSSQV